MQMDADNSIVPICVNLRSSAVECSSRRSTARELPAIFVQGHRRGSRDVVAEGEAVHRDLDDVIEPSQTRSEIVKALRLLRTKRASLPPKKHGNIPL